jgi:hypothetical protein
MTAEVELAMVKLREAIYETRKLLQIKQTPELLHAVNRLEEAADGLSTVLSKPVTR